MCHYTLEIEHFSAGFQPQQQPVISNVGFHVSKGQCLAVVGESGSGKSVTSLHAMGLLPMPPAFVSSGSILFNGTNVLELNSEERRLLRGKEMAMVFQEPMSSLNPVLTCGFQVQEVLGIHEDLDKPNGKQRVLELFRQVQLPDPERIFSSYPHELSGGQKQRVVIAMAIACNPTLLIADEPTTALDVTVQKEILALLKHLMDDYQMAMIFITHDLGVVSEMANHVVVMQRGQVVEQGDVQTILNSPAHPYTKGLVACRPPWNRRPNRLPTVHQFLSGLEPDTQEEHPETRVKRINLLMKNTPLVEVKSLNKVYHKGKKAFHALHDVSFDIYPGETLGLVGESGCGKTTLSRTLLQLIAPSSGQVIYGGKDVTAMKANALRKFRKDAQLIFQDPYASLNPRKTVRHTLTEVMKVHRIGNSRQKASELMSVVGLPEESLDKYPHEFSGGQRQRIVIARALAVEPRFIICDESVSALDVSVQAQVLNLLNDLKEQFQLTYIFISHDLSVVRYMSDRILVMNQGRIEELAEADQLCINPLSDYTRRLVDSIPGMGSALP
ncbi:MAG: ABC transporter ATP-binding protein [Flavobacteriales bacterium]|nr:ABC transporter ATP-binding protein [Flavobacteriales bacterium]